MEGTMASIQMFGGNYAPRTFAFCNGALLPISSNTALFSLLNSYFGGDARTTFGLPDMRGRTPVGTLQGPGLQDRSLGQKWGREYETLSVSQMPQHSHGVTNTTGQDPLIDVNIVASTQLGASATPSDGDYLSAMADGRNTGQSIYGDGGGSNVFLGGVNASLSSLTSSLTIEDSGLSQSFFLSQPSLATSFVICMQGVYPSRN
jgi:microcystin-dependent protein